MCVCVWFKQVQNVLHTSQEWILFRFTFCHLILPFIVVHKSTNWFLSCVSLICNVLWLLRAFRKATALYTDCKCQPKECIEHRCCHRRCCCCSCRRYRRRRTFTGVGPCIRFHLAWLALRTKLLFTL